MNATSLAVTGLLCLAALAPAQPSRCAALRSLTGFDFTVATARHVPASGDLPEHCAVAGQVLPEIRFEVYLPANWNKRLLMRGNGGYAGNMDRGGALRSLRSGFASAVTDTGHDAAREPLATFAPNRQKLYDYAFRSMHTTAVAAKQLIRAYYGTPAEKSYWNGCSTGGRQALIMAQRFPEDFDGIIAGAPVLDFTGTMIQFALMSNAVAETPVPLAKVRVIAKHVLAKCDKLDGAEDGLLEDPRQCAFSPSRDLPVCAGAEAADCLTAAQIKAVERIYSPVLVNGKRIAEGWPLGAEVSDASGRVGWSDWIVKDDGPTIGRNFAESFFRYMAFDAPPNPAFEISRLIPEKDSSRIDWLRAVLDARDTDLSAFRSRGGKLLMYFGWADPALNPLMGIGYYEDVRRHMGPSTPDFFRLFMMPGVFHCSGGPGGGTFDMVPPIVDWVEKGVAPTRIVGAQVVDGKPLRTRPFCPYPQVARYNGPGDINDAASFTCAEPQNPNAQKPGGR